MKHTLAALLVLVATACCSLPDSPKGHAVRLGWAHGGVCSGTKVGQDVILTAEHCVTGGVPTLLDGTPVVATIVRVEGVDQVRLVVDRRFNRWARIATRKPAQGDAAYYWGNPVGIHDMLRRGYIAGRSDKGALLIDIEVGKGDSGAGVYNARGELVGVVSAFGVADVFRMAVVWPVQ